jgi:hypothetical protein
MIASSLAFIPLTIALIPAASIEEEGINCYNKEILGQTSSKTLCSEYYTQRIFNAEYICICYYPIVTYTAFMSMDTRAKALS